MSDFLSIYIGFDSREAAATEVAAHSIRRRANSPVNIQYLKHRELRKKGIFTRAWLVDALTGGYTDLVDNKPFSTEFSHTRFLVPHLMNHQGWALFMDADMVCLSDIAKLFALRDESKAIMCVKHNHVIKGESVKMDDRIQLGYTKKNWSSFVLWNCGHPANSRLTPEFISTAKGADLHRFSWLPESLIGELPIGYNYIPGVSPKLPIESGGRPLVIHYTEGGPWFENCRNVPYADYWLDEYEDWQASREDHQVSEVPTTKYDKKDV